MDIDEKKELQKKPIWLMAAACRNMGIGKNGQLPWDLPTDFSFMLKTITTVSRPGRQNMVIWGRSSWFSCPESVFPLANSINVVLSKKLMSVPKYAQFICEDFDKAISLASKPPLNDSIEAIWILGGTQVYKEALEHPWCDLIYLTDIMADFECDVFFPNFDQNMYRKQNRFPGVPSEIQEENGIKFEFQVFKKET